MGLVRRFTKATAASNVLVQVVKIVLIVLTCVFIVPAVFAYAVANILIRRLLGLPTNPTEARLLMSANHSMQTGELGAS